MSRPTNCMVPRCDQPAVVLLANDSPLMSPEYAERWVCRWHRSNPFIHARILTKSRAKVATVTSRSQRRMIRLFEKYGVKYFRVLRSAEVPLRRYDRGRTR